MPNAEGQDEAGEVIEGLGVMHSFDPRDLASSPEAQAGIAAVQRLVDDAERQNAETLHRLTHGQL